jgi:hypothetical protein
MKLQLQQKKTTKQNLFVVILTIILKMDVYFNGLTSSVNGIFSFSVLPVGIVLNLFSINIFRKPALNKTNMGFLNTCQSTADIFLLAVVMLLVQGQSLVTVAEFPCRFFNLLRRFAFSHLLPGQRSDHSGSVPFCLLPKQIPMHEEKAHSSLDYARDGIF